MKRPLFTFAVLFLGALALIQLRGGASGFVVAGGALLAAACLPRRKGAFARQLALCGAAASVAALAAGGLFALRLEGWQALEGRSVSFSGWMEEASPYDPSRVTLRGRAAWAEGSGRVRLALSGMTEEVSPGDWLAGELLVVSAWEDGDAPGGVTLSVRAEAPPEPVPAPEGFHPLAGLAALRWRLSQRLWEARPGEDTGAVLALLFSRQDKLPARRLGELDRAGLRHLLVVSGLHLSLLLGWAEAAARRFGLDRRLGSLLSLSGIFLLAGMAGFSVSVVRAGVMAGLCHLGRLALRRADSLTSLGAGGAVLAALSPPVLFTLGWQLTLAATLGLLAGAGPLSALLEERLVARFGRAGRFGGWVTEGLSASAAAQLGALPVLAAWLGRVSLWGVVTTLPALPLVAGGILLGGTGALLLSLPLPDAPGLFLLDLARMAARLLLLLARGAAGLADLSFPVLLPWQLALCAAIPPGVFFCLYLFPRLARRRERRALGACLLGAVLALGCLWRSGRGATVISLGEGGGVVISTPAGTLALDPGESLWDRRRLSSRLPRQGDGGPLVLAFSQGAEENTLLAWQRELSPAALCLPGPGTGLLEHQLPGVYLPLGAEPREVLPGIHLSAPAPHCLVVEAGGVKMLKSSAPYPRLEGSPVLEEAGLLVDRRGNAFARPEAFIPARMPGGERNLVL